ncbi:MAG: hypothetical protein HC822_26810 [Oscillochloris sp.]|nr:hypothetical protein [Oscillochloris sp.]
MTTLMATYTDAGNAERAAAALREQGFKNVTTGTAGGIDTLVGLGATVDGFRQQLFLTSTLGGTLTLGALGGFIGLVAASLTEFRNMGTIEYIDDALSVTLIFAVSGIVLGLIAGIFGGILLSWLFGNLTENTLARGNTPTRPLVTVTVDSSQAEDLAFNTLRSASAFEIARRRPQRR